MTLNRIAQANLVVSVLVLCLVAVAVVRQPEAADLS